MSGVLDRISPQLKTTTCVTLLLGATAMLAMTSVAQKSVTIDEFVYAPHGLAIWKSGAFHMDDQVVPLPKLVMAVPLLFSDAAFDTGCIPDYTSSWECGHQFADQNVEGYHHYFFGSRMVSVLVLLLLSLLTMGFARSLYGHKGALLAGLFTCLCPTVLAHGRLATADIYSTAAIVGALWAFDAFWRHPDWKRGLVLGFVLGLATLCKFTGLLLFILLPIALAIVQLATRRIPRENGPSGRAAWGWMVLGLVFGVFIINLGYLFDGSFTLLGNYTFTTGPFTRLQAIFPGWLPIPLPYYFFKGMDTQLGEAGYVSYLLGKFSDRGFPHYYLVALAVKTTVPALALWLLAFGCRPRLTTREIPILFVVFALLLFFSLVGHKNIGVRYVLFVYPLMAIWIGRLPGCWERLSDRAAPLVRVITLFCVFWLCLVTLLAWPHYLAFFNVASGGPANGHKYLLDSNLDWGQDLPALKHYMAAKKIPAVDLAYCGKVRPEYYGIAYTPFDEKPAQTHTAISANFLWGRMYFMNGTAYWPPDPAVFVPYRDRKPEAVLGHTIYVFRNGEVLGSSSLVLGREEEKREVRE